LGRSRQRSCADRTFARWLRRFVAAGASATEQL